MFSAIFLILEGTIEGRLISYTEKYPSGVNEIRDDLYVNNLVTGGENIEQVTSLKDRAIEIFHGIGLKRHKLHSNFPAWEGKNW